MFNNYFYFSLIFFVAIEQLNACDSSAEQANKIESSDINYNIQSIVQRGIDSLRCGLNYFKNTWQDEGYEEIENSLSSISIIHQEIYQKIRSEQDIDDLALTNALASQIKKGYIEAKQFANIEEMRKDAQPLLIRYLIASNKAELFKKVGSQSWADKDLENNLNDLQEEIRKLSDCIHNPDEKASIFYENELKRIHEKMAELAQEYLTPEKLENVPPERVGLLSKSSTSFSLPFYGNNPFMGQSQIFDKRKEMRLRNACDSSRNQRNNCLFQDSSDWMYLSTYDALPPGFMPMALPAPRNMR